MGATLQSVSRDRRHHPENHLFLLCKAIIIRIKVSQKYDFYMTLFFEKCIFNAIFGNIYFEFWPKRSGCAGTLGVLVCNLRCISLKMEQLHAISLLAATFRSVSHDRRGLPKMFYFYYVKLLLLGSKYPKNKGFNANFFFWKKWLHVICAFLKKIC